MNTNITIVINYLNGALKSYEKELEAKKQEQDLLRKEIKDIQTKIKETTNVKNEVIDSKEAQSTKRLIAGHKKLNTICTKINKNLDNINDDICALEKLLTCTQSNLNKTIEYKLGKDLIESYEKLIININQEIKHWTNTRDKYNGYSTDEEEEKDCIKIDDSFCTIKERSNINNKECL